MTHFLIACLFVSLTIAFTFVGLWIEERRKRRDAEDERLIEELRAVELHEQIPFPYGERLP